LKRIGLSALGPMADINFLSQMRGPNYRVMRKRGAKQVRKLNLQHCAIIGRVCSGIAKYNEISNNGLILIRNLIYSHGLNSRWMRCPTARMAMFDAYTQCACRNIHSHFAHTGLCSRTTGKNFCDCGLFHHDLQKRIGWATCTEVFRISNWNNPLLLPFSPFPYN